MILLGQWAHQTILQNFVLPFRFHFFLLTASKRAQDRFVRAMYTNVKAFKTKLSLFSRQMSGSSFLSVLILAAMQEVSQLVNKHSKQLDGLHIKLCHGLSKFQKFRIHLKVFHAP